MSKQVVSDLVVKVYGHPNTPLLINIGVHRCGTCLDGVCFAFSGEGGWVIPYADLRNIVNQATRVRRVLRRSKRVKP